MSVPCVRRPIADIATIAPRVYRAQHTLPSRWRYYSSRTSRGKPLRQRRSTSTSKLRWSGLLSGTAAAAYVAYTFGTGHDNEEKPDIVKATNVTKSTEDFGSQYVRAKRNLDSANVYVWGSNMYRVADPESTESVIKKPRKLRYFEGQVLRDLKLDEKSGAAITEKGDLVQWGKGFSEIDFKATKTLTGKGLVSLCMSQDRIIALASDGSVYSLPISKSEQNSGRKLRETSWLPFWSGSAGISYRVLKPALKLGEKVTALSGGLEHVLLLTSSGRVYSVASSTESFPSRGQLGIPGMGWKNRPKGPVDTCHEITTLGNSKIIQVAAGDYHSVALSSDGRVFVFGDNSFGQLGVDFNAETSFNDTPTELPLKRFYRSKAWQGKVTGIAAGGMSTFFTVDAKLVLDPDDPRQDQGRTIADTWACGKGISGVLGNGRWTHLQDEPSKVKNLSGLVEYDERAQKLRPIHLRGISVGATHASAVLDNISGLESPASPTSDNTSSRGLDLVWWGGNEFFQLGTGKRSNLPKPTHISVPAVVDEQGNKEEARLQITPTHKYKMSGRKVTMEQRVECGKYVSAIYSAV